MKPHLPVLEHSSYKRLRPLCRPSHPESWTLHQLSAVLRRARTLWTLIHSSCSISAPDSNSKTRAVNMAVVEAVMPAVSAFPSVQTSEDKHFDNVSTRRYIFSDFSFLNIWQPVFPAGRSPSAHVSCFFLSPECAAVQGWRVYAQQQRSRWRRQPAD